MDSFYEEFEADSLAVFKRFPEDQRERIQELYVKETEIAQAKLEKEALRKWEEDKKAEELKQADEDKKKAADPKAKKAAPAKGKGKDDKPNIDVPKLAVPEIVDYTSSMGRAFVYERSMSDIAEKLMKPAPTEEEENNQDADKVEEEAAPEQTNDATKTAERSQTPAEPTEKPEGEEGEEEEKKEEWLADVVENDFLEKAELKPPKDPEGEDVMVADLILTPERIIEILAKALETVSEWLVEQKKVYHTKCKTEGKQLQDESVEELDENLRKQWPRKGRLEVEVYQERKSQITNHNRKYERQVRACLEKYNNLEEEWGVVLDQIKDEFEQIQHHFARLKDQLPQGKNLAQLQGTSRREKDATQQFEERCRELQDQLDDLSSVQTGLLIKGNNDMLASCQLFENGGNYDKPEVEWYQGQIDEINNMITTCKEQRTEKVAELVEEMNKLQQEP